MPTAAAGWRGAGRRAWEARARGPAELTRPGSGRGGATLRSCCASSASRGALGGRRGRWLSPPGRRRPREGKSRAQPGGRGRRGPGLLAGPESPRAGGGPHLPGGDAGGAPPSLRRGLPAQLPAPRGWERITAGAAPGCPRAPGPGPAGRGRRERRPGSGPEPLPAPHHAFLRSAVGVVPLCCRGGARS